MTPWLLLTRPEAQSHALAQALGHAARRVVISPVMEIVPTGARIELAGYRGVILTSINGVRFAPDLSGVDVYCVGPKTAEAARARGAVVRQVALDAQRLIDGFQGIGPLVHLRGEHGAGDVANTLNSAGIETDLVVIYRQEDRPLSAEARALLAGDEAVIVPLYSPRTARLVGAVPIGEGVRAIALSPAVAEAWRAVTGRSAEVCASPTGAAIKLAIDAALRE